MTAVTHQMSIKQFHSTLQSWLNRAPQAKSLPVRAFGQPENSQEKSPTSPRHTNDSRSTQHRNHMSLGRTHCSHFGNSTNSGSSPDVTSQTNGFSQAAPLPSGWPEIPLCSATALISSSTLCMQVPKRNLLSLHTQSSLASLTPATLLAHFDLLSLAHGFKKQLSGNKELLVHLSSLN